MPKVDGSCSTCAGGQMLKAIPVVMLTSREEQDLVRGYRLGANASW
jgi:DNA-binding response OmpR family regulator